jgi:hypothetical protein
MLNKDGVRELAYVVKIDGIEPIVGSDNCEAAVVGGWKIMVRKNTFKAGDLAVYFEIDSQVPATEQFAFLEKKHYKVKTQKYTFGGKGNFVSQGLLMAFEDFTTDTSKWMLGTFLTQELGVKYADPDDNKRKGASADKYKLMAQRRPDIFKKKWARWFMRREWGKKLMFLLFGKKRDKKNGWPNWVVKTDEERIQNLTHMIPEFQKENWIATEKVDGTSTTFTMKGFGRSRQFFVCSRNVVFDKPDKACFYETNVYTEMAEKYNIEKVLEEILFRWSAVCDFVTIQGETYGGNIQKRDYSTQEHKLAVFNVILGFEDGHTERLNPIAAKELMDEFNIPTVPIVDEDLTLPGTCEEILALAAGESKIDGLPREGLVFRTKDGARSFKAVDNGFLLQYHG